MTLYGFALSILCAMPANAGTFIEKSPFVQQSVVVGFGQSAGRAKADALSALPKADSGIQYQLDPENSPVLQCQGGGAPDMTEESCGAALWQITVPLIRIER